jgi:hypothetical protein
MSCRRKEKTKERTKNAVSGIISTRTQLTKDKKNSRNSGFCYSIGKAMAVLGSLTGLDR